MKFPDHKCELVLMHNQCRNFYQTVKQWVEEDEAPGHGPDFVSEEQKALAIERNDVWVLQWYPETPNGFHALAAHDLQVLLDAASAA